MGYSKREALGHNCRFLQGPNTEIKSVEVIQDSLSSGVDCHVKITNYKKNGKPFQNLLSLRPVHDASELSVLLAIGCIALTPAHVQQLCVGMYP